MESKTAMQELIKWMDDNKAHCTYGTIRGKATELLESYASHPSPMSAEQVEELAEKYASEEFDKHSFSEFKGAENSLWENRKDDFIAGYNASTTPSVKADGWVSVEDGLPEEGQIVDIWEMPRTQILERNLSFKGTDYAKKHYDNTDYYGWRSTNYKFTIEDNGEGKINCFTNTNERYFNIHPGGAYHKKLCVENGEVTHWQPLPAPPNVNN